MRLYKYSNGTHNASGPRIKELRESSGLSQEQLASRLQLAGLNLTQKAISRIETGDRIVADYELIYFSKVLCVTVSDLLGHPEST